MFTTWLQHLRHWRCHANVKKYFEQTLPLAFSAKPFFGRVIGCWLTKFDNDSEKALQLNVMPRTTDYRSLLDKGFLSVSDRCQKNFLLRSNM